MLWGCLTLVRPGPLPQLPEIANPFGWEVLRPAVGILEFLLLSLWIGIILAAALSLLLRFRRARGDERLQLKWLSYAVTAWAAVVLISFPIQRFSPEIFWLVDLLLALLFAGVPISIGIAVLRYRLYDIDLLINRTLVYLALTACVTATYALVVVGAGVLLQARGSPLISLLATVVVAVLFAPLRDWLQRGVNHLLYGERDDPYTALARLGQRLQATLSPDAILPTLVQTVAETLKLPYVAIALHTHNRQPGNPADMVVAYGQVPDRAADQMLVLPLTYHAESIGRLLLAPRSPGEAFSPADRRLLDDLLRQAGAAVHAVQLTAALQAGVAELSRSRERLVMAQEEERRRIQRDLHDGLGPILASMRLRLEACLDQTASAPGLASDLLRLDELVGQATADIRRLVHDLRPPALDQLGLVPALRQHTERFSRETGIAVQLNAAPDLAMPAAVEVAFFRIVQEALTNVHKHARASRAIVQLKQIGQALMLHISDDGVGGAGAGQADGTGISGMRERAELLGGTLVLMSQPGAGTQLEVWIPLREVPG